MQQVIRDMPSLVAALAKERKRRGYSQLAFDDRVGLAEGHTAKIESGARNLGPMSLPVILQALGCVLVLAPVRSVHGVRLVDASSQIPLPLDMPRSVPPARAAKSRKDRRA